MLVATTAAAEMEAGAAAEESRLPALSRSKRAALGSILSGPKYGKRSAGGFAVQYSTEYSSSRLSGNRTKKDGTISEKQSGNSAFG